jgi:polar amino acid transport system substrate-binding protein
MLNAWVLRFCFVCASAAAFVAGSFASSDAVEKTSSKVIRFAADFTFAPGAYFDEKHVMSGSDYELCNAVAARIGAQAAWSNLPFGRLLPDLNGGRFDAACSPMYITPERAKRAAFIPYERTSHGAVVAKGNPHAVHGLNDLCGLRAVEVRTTVYEKEIEQRSRACVAAGKRPIALKVLPTAVDILGEFIARRADVWLAGEPIIDFYVRKQPRVLEQAFLAGDPRIVAIAVVPGNMALAQEIGEALAAMRADGSYQKILGKYGLERDAISVFTPQAALGK